MGEARKEALRVDFDRSVKVTFHGAKVTSDGGLLLYRELDETFAFTTVADEILHDLRTGSNVQHSLTALFRQAIYSRLAGYEDTNDAERLSFDPVMRHVVGGWAVERHAASTSEMSRFETDVLTQPENLAALRALPGEWIDRVRHVKRLNKLILDLDSSVSETYGQQEGRHTTATSDVSATIRSSASTKTAMWILPSTSERMRRVRSRSCMSSSKPRAPGKYTPPLFCFPRQRRRRQNLAAAALSRQLQLRLPVEHRA